MADYYQITKVISKVLQIICMIGAIGLLVAGIIYLTYNEPSDLLKDESRMMNICGMAVSVYGLPDGDAVKVLGGVMIVGAGMLGLLTMVFRNINLIVLTAKGETWFSKGATPFQEDTVRMVREIGIFLIFLYVAEIVASAVAFAINQDVETSTSMIPLFIGIIVICLSKMFEYGQKLQEEQDGLI